MCQYQIVLHCYIYFAPIWCDGVVFFVDRSLLMGANLVTNQNNADYKYTIWIYSRVPPFDRIGT